MEQKSLHNNEYKLFTNIQRNNMTSIRYYVLF